MPVRTRYMGGIASRLQAHHNARSHKQRSTSIEVPYRRSSIVNLDAELGAAPGTHGTVRVWRTVILNPKESSPAREFSFASAAEMWTLNGQTHHGRPDRHFSSKRIGLDALRGHLVVEVELDDLSPDAKSLVVTTSRTNRSRRQIGAKIEEAIDQVIASDDKLKALNQQIREEAFRKASSQQITGLDKALRQFGLLVRRPKAITVTEPGTARDRKRKPTINPLDAIAPLHTHPKDVFQFRTVLRERIRVKQGKTASVLLEVDAIDGYFDGSGASLSLQFVPDIGEKLRFTSQDSLEGGRMRIRIRAARDAPLIETKLIASCLPPNANAPFTAEIPIEIIDPRSALDRDPDGKPRNRRKTKQVEQDAPPQVVVAYDDHAEHSWQHHGLNDWNTDTVGQYKNDIAYVNGDFTALAELRSKLPTNRHDDITSLYVAPVGMTVVGLHESEQDPPEDNSGTPVELHSHYRKAALRSAALSSIFAIRYMNERVLLGDPAHED